MNPPFLSKTVYVKVYENRFVVKLIGDNRAPVTLMSQRNFTTRRLLVGEYSVAEDLLSKGIKELFKGSLFASSPFIVIHPIEKTEDGLSQVEERLFRELAIGAGARDVVVWVGQELSDEQVQDKTKKTSLSK